MKYKISGISYIVKGQKLLSLVVELFLKRVPNFRRRCMPERNKSNN
jgi:hypothetical protein